jgi:hypothetical protein
MASPSGWLTPKAGDVTLDNDSIRLVRGSGLDYMPALKEKFAH